MKEFVSLTMVATEQEKDTISVIITTVAKEEKFYQKHESYKFELPLKKLSRLYKYEARKNDATLLFEKNYPKVKKHFYIS